MRSPPPGLQKSRRSGKILIWVVLSLSVIIGIVAINLDGGRMLDQRRHIQAAADAAALAAGADLYANWWTNQGQDPKGTARTAALNAAAANGVPASAVTVNVPPASGTFAGQAGYVEVLVNSELPATFGKIFTRRDLPVCSRSVARGQPMKIGLILLRPTGSDSFLNKGLAFTLVNSPLIVNSSDPAAFDQASFGVILASQYEVTGGYINPGGALMLGPMRTGVSPTPDPLEFLPVPSTAGVPVVSSSPKTVNSILPTILQPGIYQGGIHVTGLATVTMLPGVYIMQGGGFKVDGSATVVGLEVMIYNTTSGSYAAGPISIRALGKVVLAAPLSGTYQGINFFQDRSLATPLSMTGVGLATITGVIYAAAAPVNLTGSRRGRPGCPGRGLRGQFHDGPGDWRHQRQPEPEPAACSRCAPGRVSGRFHRLRLSREHRPAKPQAAGGSDPAFKEQKERCLCEDGAHQALPQSARSPRVLSPCSA